MGVDTVKLGYRGCASMDLQMGAKEKFRYLLLLLLLFVQGRFMATGF